MWHQLIDFLDSDLGLWLWLALALIKQEGFHG